MFNSIIKPTLALMIISVLVGGSLALTYNVTGIGEIGNGIPDKDLEQMKDEVMPQATLLKETKVTLEDPALLGVYKDEGGAGTAFYVLTKGYGGDLKVMVGINNDGAVTGIKIVETLETPGLGSKIENLDFREQFYGKENNVTVEKGGPDIDAIAGATISSKALGTAVNLCFSFFEQVKGELL